MSQNRGVDRTEALEMDVTDPLGGFRSEFDTAGPI